MGFVLRNSVPTTLHMSTQHAKVLIVQDITLVYIKAGKLLNISGVCIYGIPKVLNNYPSKQPTFHACVHIPLMIKSWCKSSHEIVCLSDTSL